MTAASLRPRQLDFRLGGGQQQPECRVRWSAGKVEFQVLPPESEQTDQEHTTALFSPSRDQWETFWRVVDDLGVWAWSHEYRSSSGRTNWSLVVGREGRLLKSAGLGAFPPVGSPLPTPEFKALLEALSGLLDGRSIS